MKVDELIKILSDLPQDTKVVTQDGLDYYNVHEAAVIEVDGEDKVLIQ